MHTHGPCSVLLVDSLEDCREMYREALRLSGFLTLDADNAADGLALARTADIIVTGLRLAGAEDGLDLVRSLRRDERTRTKPIIVLSAWAHPADRQRALDAGCDVFLTKPCLPDVLIAEVQKSLSASRLAQSRDAAPEARAHPVREQSRDAVREEETGRARIEANRGRLVLNVDDSESSRYLKERQLQTLGFTVESVGTGKAALELTARLRPTLVLLDVHLPDIDGREVCRIIKNSPELAGIRVVLISSTLSGYPDHVQAFRWADPDAFINEPVEYERLGSTLEAVLRAA
jgi:two-component system cell cycle response regulator DivK